MRKSWAVQEVYPVRNTDGSILYGCAPFCETPNGNIYGAGNIGVSDRMYILVSSDNWQTLTTLLQLPLGAGKISGMLAISDTVLLISTFLGNIYRSVAPFTQSTLVLTMTTPGAYAVNWNMTFKGNLVFVSEYGNKTTGDNARRIYMSLDGGETFTECYQTYHGVNAHIHKTIIDPFTDKLWVANGDLPGVRALTRLDGPGYTTGAVISNAIQPTGGVVFEDYILWVQDSSPYGVYKMVKADNSLSLVLDLSTNFPTYADTSYDMIEGIDGEVFIATHPDTVLGLPCGIWRSSPPHTDWQLISHMDGFLNTAIGVSRFISATEVGVLAVANRTINISQVLRE